MVNTLPEAMSAKTEKFHGSASGEGRHHRGDEFAVCVLIGSKLDVRDCWRAVYCTFTIKAEPHSDLNRTEVAGGAQQAMMAARRSCSRSS